MPSCLITLVSSVRKSASKSSARRAEFLRDEEDSEGGATKLELETAPKEPPPGDEGDTSRGFGVLAVLLFPALKECG